MIRREEEPALADDDIGPYVPMSDASSVVELPKFPKAIVRTTQASARSTRFVMTATFVMLAILALICAIGPHIPSGE